MLTSVFIDVVVLAGVSAELLVVDFLERVRQLVRHRVPQGVQGPGPRQPLKLLLVLCLKFFAQLGWCGRLEVVRRDWQPVILEATRQLCGDDLVTVVLDTGGILCYHLAHTDDSASGAVGLTESVKTVHVCLENAAASGGSITWCGVLFDADIWMSKVLEQLLRKPVWQLWSFHLETMVDGHGGLVVIEAVIELLLFG